MVLGDWSTTGRSWFRRPHVVGSGDAETNSDPLILNQRTDRKYLISLRFQALVPRWCQA